MTESGITIRQDVDTAQQQFNDREFARVRNFSHLVEHSNFVSEAAFKSLKREDQQEVMRFWHLEAASFLELARNESDPIVALTDIVGAKQVIERKYFGGSKNKSALRTEAAEPQIVLNGTDHLYLPAVMWTDIGDYNMQAYALTGDESFAQEAEENLRTFLSFQNHKSAMDLCFCRWRRSLTSP